MKLCPIGQEHRDRYNHTVASDCLGDLCFYHWAPSTRRKSIERSGLVPGSRSLQGEWRPPYICFSDDVNLAWSLSGGIHPEIDGWDLWQAYPEDVGRWEAIFDTYISSGRHYIKEYRVYHRVMKRHVHYVASRGKVALAR